LFGDYSQGVSEAEATEDAVVPSWVLDWSAVHPGSNALFSSKWVYYSAEDPVEEPGEDDVGGVVEDESLTAKWTAVAEVDASGLLCVGLGSER